MNATNDTADSSATATPRPSADAAAIESALAAMFPAGGVVELRAIGEFTDAGYFDADHWRELATEAARLSNRGLGVYVTLNELDAALLARSANKMTRAGRRSPSTADANIVRRRYFPIDIDPVRVSGVSSTDAEKQASLEVAKAVGAFLHSLGWPAPITADSGNGWHMLYRVDLPNDDATRDTIKAALEALAEKFNTDAAKVDTSVHNAARIWKLYGTTSAKGSHTPERPHRLATLRRVPDAGGIVTAAMLAALAPDESEPRPAHASAAAVARPTGVDEVRAMLAVIPSDDRVQWVKIGMILRDAFGDAGFPLWDEWSAKAANYGGTEAADREWKTFANRKVSGRRATVATIARIAKENGYTKPKKPKAGRSRMTLEAPADTFKGTIEDFIYYAPERGAIYVPSREVWSASALDDAIEPWPKAPHTNEIGEVEMKPIPPSRYLSATNSVNCMTWHPGIPELVSGRIVVDGGWIDVPGSRTFNRYNPPRRKPGNRVDVTPWLEHLARIYGDAQAHLVNYFAHRIQFPGVKVNHALVLGGDQGIGKDSILHPVALGVGPWNVAEVSPHEVMGSFNPWVQCVMLRISEARDLGDLDRFAFYDLTKRIIAAPPDVIPCNQKHLRPFPVFNVCGTIITTNYKTNGIYLPGDDRRHYVAWSDAKRSDFTPEYWRELWSWYHNGGEWNVVAYLEGVDLSNFDPKAEPQRTSAWHSIVESNRAPEASMFADVIDTMAGADGRPPIILTVEQLTNAARDAGRTDLVEWIADKRNRRIIGHRMEEAGYVVHRNAADRHDGQWKVGERRVTVYAHKETSVQDRGTAVAALVEATRRRV